MTVSPASQRRINRAVNQWIKARNAEKDAPTPGVHRTPDGRTLVRLSPERVKFLREAGLDPATYTRFAIQDMTRGFLPADYLSNDKWIRRAAKWRHASKNPITGTWAKRNDKSGKFVEVKTKAKPFTGQRQTSKTRLENEKILREASKRFGGAMRRLAKR